MLDRSSPVEPAEMKAQDWPLLVGAVVLSLITIVFSMRHGLSFKGVITITKIIIAAVVTGADPGRGGEGE